MTFLNFEKMPFHCFWPILVIIDTFFARRGLTVISRHQEEIFQFCKKHFLPHISNIKICTNNKFD